MNILKKELISAWKAWSTTVNSVLPSASAVLALPQCVDGEMSETVRRSRLSVQPLASLSQKIALNGTKA